MIQKQRPPGHYTMIGNEVFRDTRLNLADRGLLSTLLSLPDAWNFTITGLTAILPDGKDHIRKSLKHLEEFGYLKFTTDRDNKGKFTGTLIEIRNYPETGNPYTVNPATENPPAVNPATENPPEYKIDKYKTVLNIKNNDNRTKNSFQNFEQRSYSQDFYKQLEEKMSGKYKKQLTEKEAVT